MCKYGKKSKKKKLSEHACLLGVQSSTLLKPRTCSLRKIALLYSSLLESYSHLFNKQAASIMDFSEMQWKEKTSPFFVINQKRL